MTFKAILWSGQPFPVLDYFTKEILWKSTIFLVLAKTFMKPFSLVIYILSIFLSSAYWAVFCKTTYFVQDQDQDLSWFQFSFKTNTKTCLDFNFLSRPIQHKSWNGYFFETNTKTSLDIGNNSRPIPRVLIIDIFETNTNTAKFNPIDIEDHKGEHKNFYGTFYNKLLGLCHLQNLCLEKAPKSLEVTIVNS